MLAVVRGNDVALVVQVQMIIHLVGSLMPVLPRPPQS